MGWLGVARAPGGKAGVDSPSVHRDTSRLVSFSDAVFAITITLLVLEIRPPTDYRNLLHGLVALWPSYLAYAVTFLFIGQVWVNHHVMFDHIRAADRTVLLLNTLLLMVVAFLPFATSVLARALRSGHDQRTAVVRHHESEDAGAATFGSAQPLLHLGPQHGLLQQVSPASAGDHPEPAHPTDPAGVDRSCRAPQSLVRSETVQIDGGRRVLLLVE